MAFHMFWSNMIKILLLTTCLCLLPASVSCLNSLYSITAPKTVQQESTYQVVVTIHRSTAPVNVQASLDFVRLNYMDAEYVRKTETMQTIHHGETKQLEMKIGYWESGTYLLSISGTGGILFNETAIVSLQNSKTLSVFIQTDKSIYQPGQIVHYRIVAVNSTLHAQKVHARVHINDSKGNRIKQWTNIILEKGVYASELQLSDQVVLGDWQIQAIVKGISFMKTITIAEYVLPTFEVDIRLPDFATYNDSDVVATVVSKYTYGKPVKGDGLLTVKACCRRIAYRARSACRKHSINIINLDGQADLKLNLIRDLNLSNLNCQKKTKFTFFASVTEPLSGRHQNITKDLYMYRNKYKLQFDLPPKFIPGWKYSGHLQVSLQDGSPVLDDLNVSIRYSYSGIDGYQELRYPVPRNGIIQIELEPPASANQILLEALYQGKHKFRKIKRIQSEQNLHVSLVSKKLKVGEEAEFFISSTEAFEESLILQVVGRGKVLYVTNIPGSGNTFQTVKIPVTSIMAPKARAVVYYATGLSKVRVDAIEFGIKNIFRTPVTIEAFPNDTKPGSQIEVLVRTSPNATVYLSAVDQSVLLMKSGNDITEQEVVTDLQGYDTHDSIRYWEERFVSSAMKIFTESGLVFIMDGLSNTLSNVPVPDSVEYDEESETVLWRSSSGQTLHEQAESPILRYLFPETFLWINSTADSSGLLNVKTMVPHKITSYFINAFAMDDNEGLGIAQLPTKIRIFHPFFVTLNLPYSVVRGETLALQALVFNYLPQDLGAEVTLENENGDFIFIDLENELDRESTNKKMSQSVKIKSGNGVSVFFYIMPKKVGYIDLKVVAKSTVAADALLRKLFVKAEGIPTYRNKAMVIQLKEKHSLEEKVAIEIPNGIVEESEHVEVSAIGDILGTTINSIDKLLRMPYGCGEQNMLNFVPNIVVTDYLSATYQLTDQLKETAIKYMESGYQRELTYKRHDGSYSAFGNNDRSGSTWLTAFVVKSFVQAEKYLAIDNNVIMDSGRWLQQQQRNGSFHEVGKVFNKAMQGGSSQGLGLTAYVLSAFLEAKKHGYRFAYDTTITRSLQRIENDLYKIDSDYDLVLITYVLHLADSPAKDQAFEKMNSRAITAGNLKYWSMPVPEVNKSNPSTYRPQSNDIEMTAYALLVHAMRNLVSEGVPIMKWLVSKQNENGGFESTQDTVVGILALAQYAAKLANPDDAHVSVKFTYEGGEKAMTLTKDNDLVLHKEQLPRTIRKVDIKAEGNGSCVLQVTWSYNVPTTEPQLAFNISNEISHDRDMLEVKACTRYMYEEGGNSNMAVMELAFPSGYSADKENLPALDDAKEIKRVETKDDDSVVIIYFDKISNEVVCTTAKAQRNNKVADLKPALIEVYDYYDPAKRAELMYDPPKTSLCDLCETTECKEKCK